MKGRKFSSFNVWLPTSGQTSHYLYKILVFPNLFSTPIPNTAVYLLIKHSPLYPCLPPNNTFSFISLLATVRRYVFNPEDNRRGTGITGTFLLTLGTLKTWSKTHLQKSSLVRGSARLQWFELVKPMGSLLFWFSTGEWSLRKLANSHHLPCIDPKQSKIGKSSPSALLGNPHFLKWDVDHAELNYSRVYKPFNY